MFLKLDSVHSKEEYVHNICKIKLTLSYQMHITWSCVTFYHSLNRFPTTVLVLLEEDLIY